MTRILLIGQCTLHVGRMEFGNIGNYYIIEPLVRELHRAFPGAEVRTTLQMSEGFCARERVTVLPMALYYGWTGRDADVARDELALARAFAATGALPRTTPFIDEVLAADVVIDFSGDIWGDNADLLGPDRFFVGCAKDRVAQLLGKPTFMVAGSPGPFGDPATLDLARETFAGFTLVTDREAASRPLLAAQGFRTDHVHDLACPAFCFEPLRGPEADALAAREGLDRRDKPLVGFVLCGWNFTRGPFDRWPRDDAEYAPFADAVLRLARHHGARVVLLSHSNGFTLPAPPFHLIQGRDYPVIKQLQRVVAARDPGADVVALDGIYSAWETKALIGRFDLLVSGRIHAAVAGLSQAVPTVIIDYGHEPKAHKLRGFAEVAGVGHLVADPAVPHELIARIDEAVRDRAAIADALRARIPRVQALARRNVELVAEALR